MSIKNFLINYQEPDDGKHLKVLQIKGKLCSIKKALYEETFKALYL